MPAGVLPGHTVTFGGKGTEHPNKKAGSVRVVAVQSPHPRFEREGDVPLVLQSVLSIPTERLSDIFDVLHVCDAPTLNRSVLNGSTCNGPSASAHPYVWRAKFGWIRYKLIFE